jgi:outer membrane protein assembly factor BamD
MLLAFITGCSKKEEAVYNKSALYWYKNILKEVQFLDLEKADDYYLSLSSEHFRSPLLKEAMLILTKAHMEQEEYLLAKFYLDEYIKKFGSTSDTEFIKFLKIKSAYLSIKNPNRNQELLLNTIAKAKNFINFYPLSLYKQKVQTMLTRLHLAQIYLNDKIAHLYTKLDKPKASSFYKSKNDRIEWLKNIEYKAPDISWLRQIFE